MDSHRAISSITDCKQHSTSLAARLSARRSLLLLHAHGLDQMCSPPDYGTDVTSKTSSKLEGDLNCLLQSMYRDTL